MGGADWRRWRATYRKFSVWGGIPDPGEWVNGLGGRYGRTGGGLLLCWTPLDRLGTYTSEILAYFDFAGGLVEGAGWIWLRFVFHFIEAFFVPANLVVIGDPKAFAASIELKKASGEFFGFRVLRFEGH